MAIPKTNIGSDELKGLETILRDLGISATFQAGGAHKVDDASPGHMQKAVVILDDDGNVDKNAVKIEGSATFGSVYEPTEPTTLTVSCFKEGTCSGASQRLIDEITKKRDQIKPSVIRWMTGFAAVLTASKEALRGMVQDEALKAQLESAKTREELEKVREAIKVRDAIDAAKGQIEAGRREKISVTHEVQGSEIKIHVRLPIIFPTGNADLNRVLRKSVNKYIRDTLDQVAFVATKPGEALTSQGVIIMGYTDLDKKPKPTNDAANVRVSGDRAKSVGSYLRAKGVNVSEESGVGEERSLLAIQDISDPKERGVVITIVLKPKGAPAQQTELATPTAAAPAPAVPAPAPAAPGLPADLEPKEGPLTKPATGPAPASPTPPARGADVLPPEVQRLLRGQP